MQRRRLLKQVGAFGGSTLAITSVASATNQTPETVLKEVNCGPSYTSHSLSEGRHGWDLVNNGKRLMLITEGGQDGRSADPVSLTVKLDDEIIKQKEINNRAHTSEFDYDPENYEQISVLAEYPGDTGLTHAVHLSPYEDCHSHDKYCWDTSEDPADGCF